MFAKIYKIMVNRLQNAKKLQRYDYPQLTEYIYLAIFSYKSIRQTIYYRK